MLEIYEQKYMSFPVLGYVYSILLQGCNSQFIHSFIYFAFCKSVQGHKQAKGYRTCPITNTINIPYK